MIVLLNCKMPGKLFSPKALFKDCNLSPAGTKITAQVSFITSESLPPAGACPQDAITNAIKIKRDNLFITII
jgi:hypothetical protein